MSEGSLSKNWGSISWYPAKHLDCQMLGTVRSKFSSIPIPGNDIQLNGSDLVTQAKEEQTSLRHKLPEILKEMEYSVLAKTDQEITDASANTFKGSPLPIFVG